MAEIILTQGMAAIVDDDDYENLNVQGSNETQGNEFL